MAHRTRSQRERGPRYAEPVNTAEGRHVIAIDEETLVDASMGPPRKHGGMESARRSRTTRSARFNGAAARTRRKAEEWAQAMNVDADWLQRGRRVNTAAGRKAPSVLAGIRNRGYSVKFTGENRA